MPATEKLGGKSGGNDEKLVPESGKQQNFGENGMLQTYHWEKHLNSRDNEMKKTRNI
jgi:hypothetical protein